MKIITCYFLIFSVVYANAQNLVVNPSFEEGAICDGTTERIDTVNSWSRIAGNPSYINTNCPLSKESKSFIQGMKLPPASQGNVLSIQKMDIATECQQGRLVTALEAGKQYVIKMNVRLPIQFCQQPIQEVGVVLSASPLAYSLDRRAIDVPALALQNNKQSLITKQYEWEEISALYVANGGEQFIAIGNFSTTNTGLFENRTKKECTYIFIDAVSVSEFKEQTLTSYSPNMTLKKNQRLLLAEVSFEEGSDVLKKSSFGILKALAKTLLENPKLKVEISSHTDNSLDAMESLTFSTARAKAIVNYLEGQDVLSSQLKGLGRGNKDAITLNNSAKGRKKNERIEIKFIEL
ncbi:OmpA family protein [Aureispira anguillae]|uniref:OmpA family protein n=1 Tax=Aureispira anguillae TaxID=2864201 RepID=A0A915VK40_9BACT|nr:OmpA family protein [Aureispira anguillae]BDS09483.1 OmpA family protein [Aureispira anguillae]